MSYSDQFRNQYILTTKRISDRIPDWSHYEPAIQTEFTLYAHPDLQVNSTTRNSVTVTCIGYILDPYSPGHTTNNIIREIAEEIGNDTGVAESTSRFTGRYVLIVEKSDAQIVIPDPGALRPVLYGQVNNEIVITPSVKLVHELFDISQEISHSKRDYISQADWWIGTGTDDDRLTRLLANHYLDLEELSPVRIPYYIPPVDDPIEHASHLLSGSIRALVARFDNPHIWLSGGLDSRMLVAASRSVSDECQYVVFDRPDVKESDVKIAQQLGEELDIDVVVAEPGPVSKSFKKEVEAAFCSPRYNSSHANVEWSGNQQLDGHIAISGIVSEVARTYYEHPKKELSTDLCHTLAHLPETTYSSEELSNWLSSAKEYQEESNIDPYDLFYWEQKISNWGAKAARELDLVTEMGAPFANRELLHILLETPREDRRPPSYHTSQKIIQNCWEDCLEIPINPRESLVEELKNHFDNQAQTSLLHYKAKQAFLAIQEHN